MTRIRPVAAVCAVVLLLSACAAPITFAADPSVDTTTTAPPSSTTAAPPTTGTQAACVMTPPVPPDDTPAPALEPSTVTPSPAELAQIAEVQAQTQQLRGLPQATTPVQFIGTDQLQPTLDRYKTQQDRDNAKKIDPLAKQIGWVAESSTTEAEVQKLQQGLVLGFYIPKADTLWVVQKGESDLSPLQQGTLSHEWVHALQNAAYDLETRDRAVPQFDLDREGASSALYEGDASTFEDKWQDQYLTAEQRREKEREELEITPKGFKPGPLVGDMMMPYLQGPKFIDAVLSSSGAPPLSTVYDRPPTTSAEILHPELYLAGFTRTDVGLPDLGSTLGPPWAQTIGGTWGEYSSAMLLAGLNGEPLPGTHLRKVDGWRGDCLGLWQNGDGRFGAIATEWADEDSAVAFVEDFEKSLRRAGGDPGPGGFTVLDEDHLWKIGADGTRTVVLFTNNEDAAAAAADLAPSDASQPGRIAV